VIVRPFKLPEAVWAVAGAIALVCLGLLPTAAALRGVGKGLDVYLFLTGMMLLAEVARDTGLFDWLASLAASHARGSPMRLFRLIYAVGIVVTVFLSNDATAVVLTPAVAAVTRACRIAQPLPYLLICALIANAASFVLPISNPANLVIYGSQMPPLAQWLPRFGLPSVVAIGVTYLILERTQRKALIHPLPSTVFVPELTVAGQAAAWGIALTALALTGASAMGWQLGLPTCVAGVVTLAGVAVMTRSSPWPFLREISWGVLPLVAGLFVLVEALEQAGAIHVLSGLVRDGARDSPTLTAAGAGALVGFMSNLINNLPAGLMAGTAVQAAHVPTNVSSAILIGVDLGPNLSVTGSLATLLWLTALRRERVQVRGRDFLKLGLLVMPPALLLSLGALLLSP
jgi:arsenical pump membrane protein